MVVIGGTLQSDGVTYGSDLTDSGTVANIASGQGYAPRGMYGLSLNMGKSCVLAGDSILDGSDDTSNLLGNTGFAAIALLQAEIRKHKNVMPW